ncbi:MAG: SWIM zinc finger family protein [Kiritimatiellae bacterium]|nr:SWIM zinc finger family protein [Kiritimatiellia bacterium]
MKRNMNEPLRQKLTTMTPEDLLKWTDPRIAERGFRYLDNVLELHDADESGLLAKVQGTDKYFTRVFLDAEGFLSSECSCPVAFRCKHAVATILSASRELKNVAVLPKCSADSLAKAELAIENAMKRKTADELSAPEKHKNPIKEKERREAEYQAMGERMRIERTTLFAGFIERAEALEKRQDLEGMLSLVEEACSHTDEDFHIEPYGRELQNLFSRFVEIARRAIASSPMPNVERLLWAHRLETPYRYYETGALGSWFWNERQSKCVSSGEWRQVAEILSRELAETPEEHLRHNFHEVCADVDDAMTAFFRAGCAQEAADICARYARYTECYSQAADLLLTQGQMAEAKTVLQTGIAAAAIGDDDIGNCAPYADQYAGILAREGKHALATTILAAAFLFRAGNYAGKRTRELFDAVIAEATKAGVAEETRKALRHALEWGLVPKPLAQHGPSRFAWFRTDATPPPVPPWPLPPLPGDLSLSLSEDLWQGKNDWSADKALLAEIDSSGGFSSTSTASQPSPSAPHI